MKIVLLYPPTQGGVQSLFTFHKNEGIGFKPPLGLMSLATVLNRAGFDAACVDAHLEGLTPEQAAARVAALEPDLVGLTAWTDFWYPAWRTAALIRDKLPGRPIVLGGPHCTVYPAEALESSAADFVVAGDGEDTLLALVRDLAAGRAPGDLPGLWRKHNGAAAAPSQAVAVIEDITRIPIPDRTLLPYKKYYSVLNTSEFETTMVTSRGCPYKCIFCKMHAQKIYARTAEQVVDEFQEIAALGIADVQVYDDTFTWSKQRVMDICAGILDRGLKINWAVRDRVNKADGEMYAAMRRAGCYRIHFGVESGSPPVLKASGKAITLDQCRRAVDLARAAGFETMAYYMFGFPDETPADADKTMRFAMSLDTDYAVFAVLIPYPGTALYDLALERGIIPGDFWLDFTRHPAPDFRIPRLVEQHMDRAELIRLKDLALKKYYFRPLRLWRELLKVRSPADLARKLGMGMNIGTDYLKSVFTRGAKPRPEK